MIAMSSQPISLEELKKLRQAPPDPQKQQKKPNSLDRLALLVTKKVGSMGFFLVIFLWTAGWLSWNMLAPRDFRFDPYPAFVLWLFISNMIQLLLLPLIMVGQNLQERNADRRAEADFAVNVRAEREIETIIQHLENQNEILLTIQKKIGDET